MTLRGEIADQTVLNCYCTGSETWHKGLETLVLRGGGLAGRHLAEDVLGEHPIDCFTENARRVLLELFFCCALLQSAWVPGGTLVIVKKRARIRLHFNQGDMVVCTL